MTWNAGCECPSCCSSTEVAWVGGPINTHSGNLSYQETDLVIPVAGDPLEFRRSYASNATDAYTTTLGYGWTHNYDVQLHLENTVTDIPDEVIVELQAPGGSRLPFFADGTVGDPDTTYNPYPGVTAQLTYDAATQTYLVTGFDQSVYLFNSDGRLQSQTDADGNTLNFDYTTQNGDELLDKVYQGSRHLDFDYYPNNRLHTVTDNSNRTVTMFYDLTSGDLVSVTNALDKTSYYEYTSNIYHKLTKVTDPSGRVVEETAYDENGRAIQQWDGEGNQLVDINYDIVDTHVVTENNVVMTYTYDDRNTLIDTAYQCTDGTPGCGTNVVTGHDENFKTDSVTDANNNESSLKWSAGSTNGSNLERVTNALQQPTSMTYDQYNNLETVTDARSNTITHTYHITLNTFRTSTEDALGHMVRYTPTLNTMQNGVIVPDGLLLEQQDASGLVTSYEYSEFGEVLTVTVGAGAGQPLVTQYGYDGIGRLITTTQLSAVGSIVSINEYNDGDQLIKTIDNWDASDPTPCNTSAGVRDTNACTQYFYDDAGRIASTINTLGQTDLTFYDNAGRFSLSVSNYDGTTAYDPLNPEAALCNFSNPDSETNICHKTEYDSAGRVYTTTNSLGQKSLTLYDSLGRVDGIIQNSVNVTSLDQCSYVKERVSSDEDLCTDYTYDAVGNVTVIKDPAGNLTRTFYDELNRVEGQIINWSGTIDSMAALESSCFTLDPLRETDLCTTTEYDEVGNVVLTTDPKGQQTKTFYNEINQVTYVVANWQPGFDPTNPTNGCLFQANNTNETNICSLYGYDAYGRQSSVTNALGQVSLTVYDELGRAYLNVANWDGTTVIEDDSDCSFPPAKTDENVCTVTYYDDLGRQSQVKDALGNITDLAYDGLGRMASATQYLDGVPVINSQQFDALGNQLNATDAENHTTNFDYDGLNRLKTTTSAEGVMTTQAYNAAGWVMNSSNNYDYTTYYQYDDLGRLVNTTDPERNATSFTYDVLGNQLTMTDAENVVTRYQHDTLNRLASVVENELGGEQTDNSDVLTQYEYDILGNRTVITNARSFTQSATTYDTFNRPQIVKDALNNATTTVYDALGRVLQITDGNDEVTTFEYDGLNRLITTTYTADNEIVVMNYDALGNRTLMRDATGTTTYGYDDLYRPITITSSLSGRIVYDYDAVGNRIQLTYPDSKPVFYEYDDDNRLVEVTDWRTGVTQYEYDAIGRLITTTLPSDMITIRIYDTANRLTQVKHIEVNQESQKGDGIGGSGTETIASYQYQLDGVGNRTSVIETHVNQVTSITYDYDDLYRLTEATYTWEGTTHYEYAYDAVGNMTDHQETFGKGPTVHTVRTFDEANQLETSDDGAAVYYYFYDNNGNMTRITPKNGIGFTGYQYNQRNLLTNVYEQAGITTPLADYVYDGAGDRVQQIVDGVTTTYANDPTGLTQVLLADRDSGKTQTAQLYGLDLIGQDDGTGMRLLLADGLGSVRQEMANGAVDVTTTYAPYGKVLGQIGTSGTVYGYTGEQEDDATGLVYLRARYYSPYLNQFQSRDPFAGYATLPQSQNGYSYVHNNPINLIDPTGHRFCEFDGGCEPEPVERPFTSPFFIFIGNVTLTERQMAHQAGRDVGRQIANTIPMYMLAKMEGHTGTFSCSEEAFLDVFGGPITIYNTDENLVDAAGFPVYAIASQTEALITIGKNEIGNHYLFIHEIFHIFDIVILENAANQALWDTQRQTENTANPFPNRPDLNEDTDKTWGFADGNFSNWQKSKSGASGEEFADMGIGWTYNQWHTSETGALTVHGQARADFMSTHMPIWILQAMGQ